MSGSRAVAVSLKPAAQIACVPNVKRFVSTLQDVDERKPFDRLRAFDAAKAFGGCRSYLFKWPAMSK